MKKKLFVFLSVFLGGFVLFAAVVCIAFFSIRNNPIDRIAMSYIRNTPEITNHIGRIIHIGRYIAEKAETSDSYMRVPYRVETNDSEFIIYVVLQKNGYEWNAKNYEIMEWMWFD